MDSIEAEKILLRNRKLRSLMEEKKFIDYIADLVLRARIRKKMTQVQLAKKIGTKQPSIARVENGDVRPSLDFLLKVARALKTELIPPQFAFLNEKENVQIQSDSQLFEWGTELSILNRKISIVCYKSDSMDSINENPAVCFEM